MTPFNLKSAFVITACSLGANVALEQDKIQTILQLTATLLPDIAQKIFFLALYDLYSEATIKILVRSV